MRVKSEADVKEVDPDEYDELLNTTQWVIVLYYLPWEPLRRVVRREYCTSATTLRKLRHSCFTMVDASVDAKDGYVHTQ